MCHYRGLCNLSRVVDSHLQQIDIVISFAERKRIAGVPASFIKVSLILRCVFYSAEVT